MFQSSAIIKYDLEQDILRAILDDDFSKYYQKLFIFYHFNTKIMTRPRHGVHITIYNPQFHGAKTGAAAYDGQSIQFFWNPEEIFQGGSKHNFESYYLPVNFVGYYLPVKSDDIEKIKQNLGIVESESFRRLNLSLFTNKA